jgi:hypothetical protein
MLALGVGSTAAVICAVVRFHRMQSRRAWAVHRRPGVR